MKKIMKTIGLNNKLVVKNTFFSLASKFMAIILYMLTDIMLVNILDINDYGKWSYIFSVLTILCGIVRFGENNSTRVFIVCADDENKRNSFLNAGFVLRILISSCMCSIFFIAINIWAIFFEKNNMFWNQISYIKFGLLYVFFNTFSEFYKEINIAYNNFKRIFIITLLEYGGYFALSFIFLNIFSKRIEKPIYGVEVGYIIALLVVTIFGTYWARNDGLNLLKKIDVNKIKEIFRYALPILCVSLGAIFLTEMDTIMIGILQNNNEVAVYSVAKKISNKSSNLNMAICASVMPQFAVITRENKNKKKKKFRKIIILNGIIAGGVILCYVFIFPMFIIKLYGSKYYASIYILRILAVYYFFETMTDFMGMLLEYQKKAKMRSIFYFIMVICNLGMNYILIPKYGAIGAAIATSISMIPYMGFLIYECRKIFK